jgi:Ni/Co efflux regulator RcnB
MQLPLNKILSLPLLIALLLTSSFAFADKPHWKNDQQQMDDPQEWHKNKNKHHKDNIDSGRDREEQSASIRFSDHHREVVRQYYDDRFRSGQCPPGLAKKHNGCLPPGLAKQWHKGHRLPRDVVYYDLPPQLVISLGVPPAGQKYVRVAGDILLITVGTSMVLDAIQDLNLH